LFSRFFFSFFLLLLSNAELASVVLTDVSVLPDVEVSLLGHVHGLVVGRDQLGQTSSSLLVGHQQAVGHESLANVDRSVLGVNQGDVGLKKIILMFLIMKTYYGFTKIPAHLQTVLLTKKFDGQFFKDWVDKRQSVTFFK
jgi:hypothetical protein